MSVILLCYLENESYGNKRKKNHLEIKYVVFWILSDILVINITLEIKKKSIHSLLNGYLNQAVFDNEIKIYIHIYLITYIFETYTSYK